MSIFRTDVSLFRLLAEQISWSGRTFGTGRRTKGICEHIRRELTEIEAAPDDLSEWVDVMILAMDGAWRTGHTAGEIVQALAQKMRINQERVWNTRGKTENDPIEHDRSIS
jgi:hypothetical protein